MGVRGEIFATICIVPVCVSLWCNDGGGTMSWSFFGHHYCKFYTHKLFFLCLGRGMRFICKQYRKGLLGFIILYPNGHCIYMQSMRCILVRKYTMCRTITWMEMQHGKILELRTFCSKLGHLTSAGKVDEWKRCLFLVACDGLEQGFKMVKQTKVIFYRLSCAFGVCKRV